MECLDDLARITSEELAITHFVKSGTLQNACSTRPRVVVGLGKSAHSHTVRLMNNRRKGLKRKKMVDGSGKPDGRNESNAQIRTLLDEQRQMIIAEYCEKNSHHELQAARAEQERRLLQEELLRQQQEFREVHQQDLMKHLELQKFQNSENQQTIMDLSGRLQELQNEVNLMNDSKDFMDAESICSGNPHVTSTPGLFPKHPPFEGLLKPVFISQRQDEEPPNIWDTSGISGNIFANPRASSSVPYPHELNLWGPFLSTSFPSTSCTSSCPLSSTT